MTDRLQTAGGHLSPRVDDKAVCSVDHVVIHQHSGWAEGMADSQVDGVIARALEAGHGALVRAGRPVPGGEVAVVLCDDGAMRALNHRYRGRDAATNVLAFPAGALPGSPPDDPGERLGAETLGDIVLAWQTVRAEALDRGLVLADHVSHLVVHGFLHLCGYDHGDAVEADVMERLEVAALAMIDVADPYTARGPIG